MNGGETGTFGTDLISSMSRTRRLASQRLKAQQRIVIGAGVFRSRRIGEGVTEHPAYRDAINRGAFDGETDAPSREDVHDHLTEVTSPEDRFTSKQIEAPEAALGVAHEAQPGRAIGTRLGSVMFGEHAANDLLVDRDTERARDLLGDAHATALGMALLHLDDCRDEFRGGAFGTGHRSRGARTGAGTLLSNRRDAERGVRPRARNRARDRQPSLRNHFDRRRGERRRHAREYRIFCNHAAADSLTPLPAERPSSQRFSDRTIHTANSSSFAWLRMLTTNAIL